MRFPAWFWIAMGVWLVIGLPSFILAQGFRGHFSLLPDPPPFLYSDHLIDQTLGTFTWAVATLIAYLPVFVIPALLVSRWRNSRREHAED